MTLTESEKLTLRALRKLVHDDRLDCENLVTTLRLQFGDTLERLFPYGDGVTIITLLKSRAWSSQLIIDTIRRIYPLFVADSTHVDNND